VLARERVTDGVAGVARLHELIASWAEEPAEVVVGIETDRGLLVGALVAAGYQVIAVNPLAASRYRERHTISRAKSDRGDARMLADLVRTDRHHHRPAKGDSGLAEAVKVLARGHQQLVWARQRQANMLRSALRGLAPTPELAGGCRMLSWWPHYAERVGGGRSRPAPPPSTLRWPASSWKPHRWSRPPTVRWWRPRWR
jgi:Transposase